MKEKALHAAISSMGKLVTQTVTMKTGYKKTIRHIQTDSFMVGEFTHFDTLDRHIQVRTDEIWFIETYKE